MSCLQLRRRFDESSCFLEATLQPSSASQDFSDHLIVSHRISSSLGQASAQLRLVFLPMARADDHETSLVQLSPGRNAHSRQKPARRPQKRMRPLLATRMIAVNLSTRTSSLCVPVPLHGPRHSSPTFLLNLPDDSRSRRRWSLVF